MATITVTNANNAGAGSLRQAILDANAGDTITFAQGLRGATLGGGINNNPIIVNKSLTINGDVDNDGTADVTFTTGRGDLLRVTGSDTSVTIRNASFSRTRVNAREGAELEVQDSTFANFSRVAGESGAKVTVSGSSFNNGSVGGRGNGTEVTVTGSRFVNGQVSSVDSEAGAEVTVTGSTFENNTVARDGAAIRANNNGTVTVSDSTFTGNEAGQGGGAITAELGSQVTVTGSAFTGNRAGSDGGAIKVDNNSGLTVTASTFSGNEAGLGGAISAGFTGTATLTNATISGNMASGSGGGIFVGNFSRLTLRNSTVTNNRADSDNDGDGNGGGLDSRTDTGITLENTVLSGNFRGTGDIADDASGTIAVARNSFFGSTASVTTGTGSPTALTAGDDAQLNALGDNGGALLTHSLQSDSPLVNAGNNNLIPAGLNIDAAGNARIRQGIVDIGAFESAFLPGGLTGGESGGAVLTLGNRSADDLAGRIIDRTLVNNTGGVASGAFIENTGNGNLVTATLSGGLSLTNRGTVDAEIVRTASTTLAREINAGDASTPDKGFLDGNGQAFLSRTNANALDVRSVGFESASIAPQAVRLAGQNNSGSEALVIDTSGLPSGSALVLDNIEFAAIVGAARVTGGAGQNYVVGDSAEQFISLGSEDDTLAGGGGNDTIGSAFGEDLLYGNQGQDLVFGGGGRDTLYGGQDADTVRGGNDADFLYGNLADDMLSGGQSGDLLFGGQGNDIVYGNRNSDTLYGNLGNDQLYGGKDADMVSGGAGDDTLAGNFADDTLAGGAGADLFLFAFNEGNDIITDFEVGQDRVGLLAGVQIVARQQDGADAVLTFTDGGTVRLIGVNAGDIAVI